MPESPPAVPARLRGRDLEAWQLTKTCNFCAALPGDPCTTTIKSLASATSIAEYYDPRAGPRRDRPHRTRGL